MPSNFPGTRGSYLLTHDPTSSVLTRCALLRGDTGVEDGLLGRIRFCFLGFSQAVPGDEILGYASRD